MRQFLLREAVLTLINTVIGRYVNCRWDMPELFARKDEVVNKDLLKVRLALE